MGEIADVADAIRIAINDAGRDIQLLKKNKQPSDPTKPWLGAPDTPFETPGISIKGLFQNLNAPTRAALRSRLEKDGQTRRFFAHILLSNAAGALEEIEDFDVVIDGNKIWQIEDIDAQSPGVTTFFYQLTVSR
jgi:hypothetical protein